MERKPTVAFVDHSFHQKTHSGDFLREILERHFSVTYFWDYAWDGGPAVSVAEINKHEYVFFEQTFCALHDVRRITAKIVWAPMYDGVDWSWSFWKYLAQAGVKIISFSEAMHARAKKFDIPSLYGQLYLDPQKHRAILPQTGRHIFFWYRGGIRFQDLKPFIDPDFIDSFLYRSNPDPSFGREIISPEDQARYKMEIIESEYTSTDEYIRLVSRANIYIAPRKKEGIGLSFIEALAMGHVVIGNNDATMNEYIDSGKDGYLIDMKNPSTLDLSDLEKLRSNSKERVVKGFNTWQGTIPRMISFIKEEFPKKRTGIHATLALLLHRFESRIPTWKRTVARQKTRIKRAMDKKSI